ncbi:MAG TPA: glycosyltransferase family A protein [Vicinamibacterales bacterium]
MINVSVVIPVYNAAPTVARAIESVLAQTHPAWEIIVVDDGSTDGSADRVMRVAGAAVQLIRQDNGGAARARNVGIARATGDVIALLDADDWWDREKLAQQVTVFERHLDLVATSSNWQWDPAARMAQAGGFSLPALERGRALRGSGESLLRYAFSMNASTTAVRRAVLQRHRFDDRLTTAEDRDVWIRLVAEGPVLFDPAVLATVAHRPDSLSHQDTDRDCACMIEVLDRYTTLVGPRAIRPWKASTYAKWAGRLLSEGRATDAWPYALERWKREWWKPKAWWLLAKCRWRAMGGGHAPP